MEDVRWGGWLVKLRKKHVFSLSCVCVCVVGWGDRSGESPDCTTEERVSTDADHPHTNHRIIPNCKNCPQQCKGIILFRIGQSQ